MNKIAVKFVKYDMDKTKKRNRKNLLVSEKTEEAVIIQLEKIHKGEKLVTIHSLEWDEEQIDKNLQKEKFKQNQKLTGEVKFFEEKKGFGFIAPHKDRDDLFFHASGLMTKDIKDGDIVEFEIGQGPKGACAIHIRLME